MNKLLSATRLLILLGAVLVMVAVNVAVHGKERIKKEGEVVYLELAPVDPRSLMQGDYMDLRFSLVQELEESVDAGGSSPAQAAREGEVRWAGVVLTADHVGSLNKGSSPANTLRLRYRIRQGRVWLGTNAFFFQEGDADRLRDARYGEFRVDPRSGEAVLVGLRNAALKAL